MEHRIRASALILKDDQLLLVHHFEKRTGEDYWLPPGGGAEVSDSSIFECAIRETREETGFENRFFVTKHLGTKIRLKPGQLLNSADPKGWATD